MVGWIEVEDGGATAPPAESENYGIRRARHNPFFPV